MHCFTHKSNIREVKWFVMCSMMFICLDNHQYNALVKCLQVIIRTGFFFVIFRPYIWPFKPSVCSLQLKSTCLTLSWLQCFYGFSLRKLRGLSYTVCPLNIFSVAWSLFLTHCSGKLHPHWQLTEGENSLSVIWQEHDTAVIQYLNQQDCRQKHYWFTHKSCWKHSDP